METQYTNEEVKLLCKLLVEYGNRPFTRDEKEHLKRAIDGSQNMNDLINVAIGSLPLGRRV